jgi:ankyrin repeat protein
VTGNLKKIWELNTPFAPANWLNKFYGYLNIPLHQLVTADPSSVFQCDNNGMFPVHVVASAGNLVAVIVLLMLCPGSAGLRDSRGRTFLHTAVERRSHNIVKFVCLRPQFNSTLNMQDNQGNTALHLAVLEGHFGIVQTLMLKSYVHLNLSNHEGKTPMDLAENEAPRGFYFGMVNNSTPLTFYYYTPFVFNYAILTFLDLHYVQNNLQFKTE